MTSPYGRSHTFDRRADGYCRGEGCGAFLVTSCSEDDDGGTVYVPGSAVQQDGPSASLTAPNGSSQRRLIETVRRALGGKKEIPALEAHGTGTALGDPIEARRGAENPVGTGSTRVGPTGGRRAPGLRRRAPQRPGRGPKSGAATRKGAMRVAQVERGSPGGRGRGRGSLVARTRAGAGRDRRRQRAAAGVCFTGLFSPFPCERRSSLAG